MFGCGKQAFWHVRLALLLHGKTIKHVHFINRDFSDKANDIIERFYRFNLFTREREGWVHTDFSVLTPYFAEYTRMSKDQIRNADIVYCTTPSTKPLFDHTILTNTEGRQKGRLIVAIGSQHKSMIEIPPEIMAQAIKRHGHGHHMHKHALEGGIIVVDSLAATRHTGEFHESGLDGKSAVELGELVALDHADESPTDLEETPTPPTLEGIPLGTGSVPILKRLSSFGMDSTSSEKAEKVEKVEKAEKSDAASISSASGSSTQHHHHHIFPHHFSPRLPHIFHGFHKKENNPPNQVKTKELLRQQLPPPWRKECLGPIKPFLTSHRALPNHKNLLSQRSLLQCP